MRERCSEDRAGRQRQRTPTLYHVSPRRNRPSIAQHGLRLSEVDNTHIWAFSELRVARLSATKSWDGSCGDNDIWVVDTTGYTVEADPHPGWDDAHLRSVSHVLTQPVPPGRLTRLDSQAQQAQLSPDELRSLADRLEASQCSGLAASWCPVHGDCTCPTRDADGERSLDGAGCCLHAPSSGHAATGRA